MVAWQCSKYTLVGDRSLGCSPCNTRALIASASFVVPSVFMHVPSSALVCAVRVPIAHHLQIPPYSAKEGLLVVLVHAQDFPAVLLDYFP